MSSNTFIQDGVKIVTEAIKADNESQYEQALMLYKKALEHFMMGLKYEKNPATKETIKSRVDGYMKRAEDLRVRGSARVGMFTEMAVVYAPYFKSGHALGLACRKRLTLPVPRSASLQEVVERQKEAANKPKKGSGGTATKAPGEEEEKVGLRWKASCT